MPDEARRNLARQKFEEVTQLPAIDVADQFVAETMDDCFAGLWGREGLSRRERRFLTLAIVAAGGMDPECRFHVRGALESGDLTPAEMIEVILQVRHYAGWPAGATLHRHLRTACEDLGLEIPPPDDLA